MPVALFPGLDGSAALRDPLIRQLRARADLQWIDYSGLRGVSPPEIARVLAERLPTSCVLLAESFGGPLALLTAALRPERVAGVMLCASSLSDFQREMRCVAERMDARRGSQPMALPLARAGTPQTPFRRATRRAGRAFGALLSRLAE